MLIALAIHSTRIAIAASPAPRNTALMRNSSMITPLAPSMTVANDALATTAGDAPINCSNAGAYATPNTPTGTATSTPSRIACTAARAAPSPSFSPIRLATIAVAPALSPIATA